MQITWAHFKEMEPVSLAGNFEGLSDASNVESARDYGPISPKPILIKFILA